MATKITEEPSGSDIGFIGDVVMFCLGWNGNVLQEVLSTTPSILAEMAEVTD